MKKILLIAILFAIFQHQGITQLILNPRYFGGFIVTTSNDTVRGTIKLPKSAAKGDFSYTDILWRIRFVDKHGNESKYFPSQLNSFTFWLENGKEITFLSRPNSIKAFGGLSAENNALFLELAINGHLKLLKGYFFTFTPNGRQSNVVNFLQKGQGSLFRYRYVLFRVDMAEYLKEDEELTKKIKQRDYHPRNINEIVNEYNDWYNKTHK